MGTKGVAATAAWVCQVSKGLREVHSTGCWWGIGILPSITFARLLSLKEKGQLRPQNSQAFSQNLFFQKRSTGIASESHTHKSCNPLIHTGHVREREKNSLAPDLLFDCSHVLDYPKIRTVLKSMTNCEWNGTWLQMSRLVMWSWRIILQQ